jgi:hypothetical protein
MNTVVAGDPMSTSNQFSAIAIKIIATFAFIALLSTHAYAADSCLQWGVNNNGFLWLSQSNNDGASLELKQTGSNLTGKGSYWYNYDTGKIGVGSIEGRAANGPVVGTIKGNAFEVTVYWSNKSIGIYTGQIGPQGLVVGKTYDKTDLGARADFNSSEPLECLKTAKGGLALGRVKTTAAPATVTSVCDAAKSARARNSPAAPGLERHCAALNPKAAGLASVSAKPNVALGRVKTNATDPKPSICDAAQSARARNSPAAPGLERQCNALLNDPGTSSASTPTNQNDASAFSPQSPQDQLPAQNPFLQNPNGYNQDNGYYQNNGGYPYNQNGQGSQGVNSVPVPKGALQR